MRKPHLPAIRLAQLLRSAHAIRVPLAATVKPQRASRLRLLTEASGPMPCHAPPGCPGGNVLVRGMHRCCRVVPAELAVTNEEPDTGPAELVVLPCQGPLAVRSARRTGFTPRCITARPALPARRASEHQRSRGRHIARGQVFAQDKCKFNLCRTCGIRGFFVISGGKIGRSRRFALAAQHFRGSTHHRATGTPSFTEN